MKNALSIDLEDWYYPELLRKHLDTNDIQVRIEESTRPILKLLDKYHAHATFFILGEVARKNPEFVRNIYDSGHEIGSHGMSHKPLWELDRASFSEELDDFKEIIKISIKDDIKIKGYRAPSFSLDNSTKWALEVLKEKGYLYDSSIFPARNKLYGLNGAPLEIYKPSVVNLKSNDPESNFLEFPLTVYDLFGFRVPVAGGFYFRVMPFFLFSNFLKRINRSRPFIFYLHPWESCKLTPRVKSISKIDYFITYWGISGVLKKLEALLKKFKFCPIHEVLGL